MRKIFMLMAAVAMLASGCSKDITSDVDVNINGNEGAAVVGQSLTIVASVDDLTRVTVTGDEAAGTSKFNWEVGDELTVVYDGKTYTYQTTQEGRTSEFTVKEGSEAFLPTDLTKPVAVFYNVKNVDAAAMTAVYDIAAEQVAGELTNKMPLYHYSANVVVENQKLVATMKPLASVVEFELKASKSWNVDAISLSNSLLSKTYAVASGVVVDAATGAISLETAEVGTEVKVSIGAAADIATARNVQAVVMGLTREVTVKETITNEDQTTTEVERTELYAPIYHDQAVLKTYKNGAENARRTIWSKYEAGATAVDEHKHIYQAVDVLKEKVADGITTAEQMKAFADAINGTTERYPAGAEFSNEDGVVVLKNNINLSAYNWIAIGCNNDDAQTVKPQFVGVFDGGNNTISGLTINHNYDTHKLNFIGEDGQVVESYNNCAGLFGVVANGGAVKNLTVEGTIVDDMADPGNNWSYVGGVVAQVSGGVVENCTSKIAFSAGPNSSGKVRLGGVVGRVYASTADVTVKNCKNEGTINISYATGLEGQSIVGGVIAIVSDGSAGRTPVVSDCSNVAAVTNFNGGKDSYVGGVFGYITRASEEASTFSNCTNTGAVCGGSTAESCTAIHIGGIVGRQNCHTLYNCVNEGAVSLSENTTSPVVPSVGGFVGVTNGGANNTAKFEKCVNKGSVTINNVTSLSSVTCLGGFIGYARFMSEYVDCENQGDVYLGAEQAPSQQTAAGGFVGKCGVAGTGADHGILMNNCKNSGTVTIYASTAYTGWHYGGGFAACCYGGTNLNADKLCGIYLEDCENTGLVRLLSGGKFRAGGFTGLNNSAAIYKCVNSGIVALERQTATSEFLGGVVGFLENNYAIIEECENKGTVCAFHKTTAEEGTTTANIYIILGGILGHGGGANPIISKCVNTGKILASHDGTLDWDETANNMVVDYSKTMQYRGALVGQGNKSLRVEDCKVGGYVGAVKGGDGEDKYEASALHKLNNDTTDRYYWERWTNGYTTKQKYSNLEFVDVE